MISGINAGIIVGIIALETTSQFLARSFDGANKDNGKIWYMFLAFFIYAPILYLLILTYDHHSKFAMSNALWNAGTNIATTVVGLYVFKESLSLGEYAGIGLITVGSIVLGYYSEDSTQN